jgi:hypothetical protein
MDGVGVEPTGFQQGVDQNSRFLAPEASLRYVFIVKTPYVPLLSKTTSPMPQRL